MPQIAIRLGERELAALDELVESGAATSRADAVRRGLALLSARAREEWIAAEYRRAYTEQPQGEEDAPWLDAAAREAFREG